MPELSATQTEVTAPHTKPHSAGRLFQTKTADGLTGAAILVVAKTALLLYYSGQFGFMSDELYFLDCAKRPAWGYADLPPLLPWLTWIVMHTLGSSLWAIRVYPAIAAGATVILAGWLAAELGGRKRAVILAALGAGFLLTPWRRWFANRWLWAGVGVLLLVVLPNVIWQATHEFPFLQLQHSNRVNHHNVILPPLQFLGAQAMQYPARTTFAPCPRSFRPCAGGSST